MTWLLMMAKRRRKHRGRRRPDSTLDSTMQTLSCQPRLNKSLTEWPTRQAITIDFIVVSNVAGHRVLCSCDEGWIFSYIGLLGCYRQRILIVGPSIWNYL